MKIVIVGLGYVGLSNAVLLAQHNEVIGVDVSQERVDALNSRISPIVDMELSEYLKEKELNYLLVDLKGSAQSRLWDHIEPTNYDEKTNFIIIRDWSDWRRAWTWTEGLYIIKSTIPVGFVEDIRKRLDTDGDIWIFEKVELSMIICARRITRWKSKRRSFYELLIQG